MQYVGVSNITYSKSTPANDLLVGFSAHMTALNRSKMTIISYRDNIKKYLTYLAEQGIELADVTSDDLEKYQAHLFSKNLIQTADVYMRAVRVLFKFLQRESVIVHNPAELLPIPKLPRQLPRNVLTEAEVAALLNAPNTRTNIGILYRAILETFYSGGLRLSELCNLKVNDADTARGFIRVNQGKGKKDRVVPIGNSACLWIRVYRELVRPKLVNSRSGDYLFLGNQRGRPIHLLVVAKKVKHYADYAGLRTKVTSHMLRHACGTHLMRHGASLMEVRAMLGHELISTTQKYTRITQQDLIAAHKKFHPREHDEH